jgi:hypothetical protein
MPILTSNNVEVNNQQMACPGACSLIASRLESSNWMRASFASYCTGYISALFSQPEFIAHYFTNSHPLTWTRKVSLMRLVGTQRRPIHLDILSRLEIDDILALGSICKQARLSLQQILRNFYNINKQLELWFTDPKAFRSSQAQCNILIGRIFARWFFSRYRMAKHTDPCLYFDKKYLDTVREYLKSDGYFEKPCDRSWNKIFCKVGQHHRHRTSHVSSTHRWCASTRSTGFCDNNGRVSVHHVE